jgi:hypothetical protein
MAELSGWLNAYDDIYIDFDRRSYVHYPATSLNHYKAGTSFFITGLCVLQEAADVY